MYHTTLLQKFIGTKHFAAGEKAIKSWVFFFICYYKLVTVLCKYRISNCIVFMLKLPTVLEIPEDKAAVCLKEEVAGVKGFPSLSRCPRISGHRLGYI